MNKTLNYYLSLPYRIELVREDENTWFARVPELPGCMTEGETAKEAADLIQEAMALWIEVALEDAQTIPEPRPLEEFSGRFVVRMTRSLHRDLAVASSREGVSLNQYVTTELARAVGREASMPAHGADALSVGGDLMATPLNLEATGA
ncbi:MAG: type II toxin-antitoxin system HicB family antitoxin [Caldilineaceae bacterium]|nr:type II toxin-antitoxin system HicB family antitoxin [Caldilineaceae bacterium]